MCLMTEPTLFVESVHNALKKNGSPHGCAAVGEVSEPARAIGMTVQSRIRPPRSTSSDHVSRALAPYHLVFQVGLPQPHVVLGRHAPEHRHLLLRQTADQQVDRSA